MKKVLLLMFCLTIGYNFAHSQCGNLYIAGVIDGPLSGGTPKGVQLCASGDITNLSIYGLGSANNGGGTDGEEFTFPAVQLTSGQCIWVAGSQNSGLAGFFNWFGIDPCFSDSDIDANGNDAYELFCNGTLADVYGDPNTDGTGECWDFLDGWAKRTTSAPSTTFNCDDWTISGINVLDGQGSNATATSPYPNPNQVNCVDLPLPVTLASFTAKPHNNKSVQLDWITSSEENNDYFSIEHSTNGRDFESIDMVAGAVNSDVMQYYNYVHEGAVQGNNYYRLRQVDLDGSFSFSPIEVVRLQGSLEVEVRPTLAESEVTVSVGDASEEDVEIEVLDILGRTVIAQTLGRGELQTELSISDLQKGHYFVRIQNGAKAKVARFIKR